jgi:hypothetical protein
LPSAVNDPEPVFGCIVANRYIAAFFQPVWNCSAIFSLPYPFDEFTIRHSCDLLDSDGVRGLPDSNPIEPQSRDRTL